MKTQRLAAILGSLVLPLACMAQWSTDPNVNNAIADGSNEQALCKVAVAPDGGTYISWFEVVPGMGYNVRMQHLDAQGREVWPHNGILISDHPQNTSLVDYALIADAQGNAVVIFTDTRNGPDLDVVAYRVSSAGAQLWGKNGLVLSSNTINDVDPRICQVSSGDFVAVWPRTNGTAGGQGLAMQVISPDGTTQYGNDGMLLPTGITGTENPAFCELIASEDGKFIVTWIRDTRTFLSSRHVWAQKFDVSGAAQWNKGAPTIVSNATVVPIAHRPKIITNNDGGAIISWHDTRFGPFDCWVQHITSDGSFVFPANGLQVSADTTYQHLDPAIAFAPGETGELFVAWSERTASQGERGLYAQKISASGERLWGDGGVTIIPVNSQDKLFPRVLATEDGCMVFCLDAPAATPGNRVLGARLDSNGMNVWGDEPIFISADGSAKGRLPVAQAPSGAAILVWEDARNGGTDIYAQLVNVDGTLGNTGCQADWNSDKVINSQDFFDFLNAFFDGKADFNSDGVTNSQDFFDFLNEFFSC